ncbi:MAG: cytochrome P450 [Oxalobacteraceae bacterium]|nr:MAG: cytochrome P450 [Oxalobacteraceae bacterium]
MDSTWLALEKIPYLWATLHECLRMMPGVSHRSARIARTEDLVYTPSSGQTSWIIPRGTPIGMTSMINHWNADLFPEPDEFRPERWLDEEDMPRVVRRRSRARSLVSISVPPTRPSPSWRAPLPESLRTVRVPEPLPQSSASPRRVSVSLVSPPSARPSSTPRTPSSPPSV